ncbi:VOC family protein [Mesobacterium pallidum]|uniref:VOC family protein n=1 Tax=Mesobacterium pallidum TaxID=2872037 RepID=UPI001EE36E28|nr:VOC family protein [Mesobacterium pallidum]
MTQAFAVWTEIPVTDMDKAMAFYNEVFGWSLTLDTSGPNPMAVFGNSDGVCGGHLYPGKPSAAGQGNTIHLATPGPLEDAMARCDGAGGKVVSPVIAIPVGRFAYALDPDGNSIGLFEAKAA